MTTDSPSPINLQSKKATTLKEAVVGYFMLVFETDGLEPARRALEQMRNCFSIFHDWPEIDCELSDFILKQKKQAEQMAEQRRQQERDAWIVGLTKGLSPGQLNLLTGQASQAPYLSSPTAITEKLNPTDNPKA